MGTNHFFCKKTIAIDWCGAVCEHCTSYKSECQAFFSFFLQFQKKFLHMARPCAETNIASRPGLVFAPFFYVKKVCCRGRPPGRPVANDMMRVFRDVEDAVPYIIIPRTTKSALCCIPPKRKENPWKSGIFMEI